MFGGKQIFGRHSDGVSANAHFEESLPGLSNSVEIDESVNTEVDQCYHVDCEYKAYQEHNCGSDVPLDQRVDLGARNKEDHDVLHGNQAQLVEVLQSVVDGFCVWDYVCHVHEVKTLNPIETQHQPVLVLLQR